MTKKAILYSKLATGARLSGHPVLHLKDLSNKDMKDMGRRAQIRFSGCGAPALRS